MTGKHRDGSSVSLTLSVSPCATPGEYIAILYSRTDVVTRERAEAERRDMSAALQTLSEPVIMMKDRVIISVNEATLRTFGYEGKEELVGQPVTVLMPPGAARAHDAYVDNYELTGVARIVGSPRGALRTTWHSTHATCPQLMIDSSAQIHYTKESERERERESVRARERERERETLVSADTAALTVLGVGHRDTSLVGTPYP